MMQLPGYRIERLIAEGGMGSVYLAVQESLDRYVALKLLKRFEDPTRTLRFFNEGRMLASLNHRNIITIHDIGVVDERHYISMEYLRGGDLKQRIAKGLEINEILDLLETLGNCLDFVHRKGIIHRDIKPENILFHEDGTPIITDFGIAKQTQADSSLTLTREGIALGSPHYLSPEQAGGKSLDGRADLYSLGILFYEMASGEKPYRGDSPIEVIVAHLTSPIPKLPPARRAYQGLLERMIAKHPDQRFDSAAILVETIRSLRQAGPATATSNKIFGFMQGLEASLRQKITDYSGARPTSSGRFRFGQNLPALRKLWENLAKIPKNWRIGAIFMVATLVTAMLLYGFYTDSGRPPTGADAGFAPKDYNPSQLHDQRLPGFRNDKPNRSRQEQSAAAPDNEPARMDDQHLAVESDNEPVRSEYKQLANPHNQGTGFAVEQPITTDPAITGYLNLAGAALKDYRLTTPQGNNAYHYYRQILDRDPSHPQAREGIKAVGNAYADLAVSALERVQYKRAKTYVIRGLTIHPDNKRLLALELRVKQPPKVRKTDDNDGPLEAGRRFFKTITSVFD